MQQKFWRKVHYAHRHWIFGCILYASGCGVSHILSVTFLAFDGVLLENSAISRVSIMFSATSLTFQARHLRCVE